MAEERGKILFVADHVEAPSHLWMRRMLEGLSAEVRYLADPATPSFLSPRPWSFVSLLAPRPSFFPPSRGTARFLGPPKARLPSKEALWHACKDPAVETILVHYLHIAIRYHRLWEASKKPVWVYSHGSDANPNLSGKGKLFPPDTLAKALALPKNVHFLANSAYTKRLLHQAGFPKERVHLCYLGVPIPPARVQWAPQDPLRCLYLGRLVPCKGPEETIRAFLLASSRGLRATLTVAGMGPLFQRCQQLQRSSPYGDRVHLVGAVEAAEGRRLYKSHHLFLAHSQPDPHTGEEESFGIAFAEAMAHGLPVVTGRSGALEEWMTQGRIFHSPASIEEAAAALLEVGHHPNTWEELSHAARVQMQTQFTLEQSLERLRGKISSSHLPFKGG